MSENVPKAIDIYTGDINEAVVKVQKATGIEIDEAWWKSNVGDQGSAEQILERFDKSYAEEVEKRTNQV